MPVAIKDDQLRYLWVNQAFTDMYGYDRFEAIGRTDDDLFDAGPLIADPVLEQRVLQFGPSEDRYETISDPSGDEREVMISTSRIDHGKRAHLLQVTHDVSELAVANHMLIEASEDLAAESAELRTQAMTDPLTGLLNLRGFEPAARAALKESGGRGAIAMVDIDHFKSINDSFGHDVGDEALRLVANALRDSTRARSDVIGRVGGDEFVVALPTLTTATVDLVAARMRLSVAEIDLITPSGPVEIGVSIGMALSEQDPVHSLDAWRKEADGALYDAKRSGKDRCVVRMLGTTGVQPDPYLARSQERQERQAHKSDKGDKLTKATR